MPSKPPPLHPPLTQPSEWWLSRSTDRPKTLLVNGSAIVASASLAFALLVSIVAWIVTHPNKPTHPETPPLSLAAVTPVSHPNMEPAATTPHLLPPPPVRVIAGVHRNDRQDVVLHHVPRSEEAPLPPPPLPPPPKQEQAEEPVPAAQAAPSPAGETYGTQVLFLNNPAAAAETARREKKLLFVMHISGNFEESCFT